MLKSMPMPLMFWGEVVKAAIYVLNHVPRRSLNGITPYEAWHDRKPSVKHLRVFGYVAHVKKFSLSINKLSNRSTLMVMVR